MTDLQLALLLDCINGGFIVVLFALGYLGGNTQ